MRRQQARKTARHYRARSASRARKLAWTRITEVDQATVALPAWLTTRMVGLRGKFGLLIATGDVLRVSSVIALNQSSDGTVAARRAAGSCWRSGRRGHRLGAEALPWCAGARRINGN